MKLMEDIKLNHVVVLVAGNGRCLVHEHVRFFSRYLRDAYPYIPSIYQQCSPLG